MGEIHDLTATELAAALRARDVGPVEVLEHYLARSDRLDATVGAFAARLDEPARAAARAAEERLRHGGDVAELPPLFGIPVAVKDLDMVAGAPWTAGSAALADNVAPVDGHVTRRLRAAGAIIVGTTTVPELGLPCYTEPDGHPPARSPWDLGCSAGGSSGGAAAAVAAGLLPVAVGSDGGGSIRIPASLCGLVGLKTSRGRVSGGPLGPDNAGLGAHGPLARTVADAALVLDAIAGPFPGDPWWAPPPAATFAAQAASATGRMRVARFAAPVIAPDAQVAPECLAAWQDASALLEGLGHEVVDVEVPLPPDVEPAFRTVWSCGAAAAPIPPDREHLLRPLTRWLRETGRSASATDYLAAYGALQRASRAALEALDGFDAVLTPTLARPSTLVGELRDDDDPAADFLAQERFTPYTSTWNVTGLPAVSLPLAWTDSGHPVGVMLAGRPAGEGSLLALAAQVEAARPWAGRHPDLW